MKKIITLFILVIINLQVKSQENNNELTKIITSSLEAYYNYNLNSNYRKSNFWYNETGDTSLFLSVENYPFNLCINMQGQSLQFVNFKVSRKYSYYRKGQKIEFQKKSIRKELRKGIEVIFLKQLKLNADTIFVVFSKEIVSYKRHLSFAVGEWGIFKYIYSEERGEWILTKQEFLGI